MSVYIGPLDSEHLTYYSYTNRSANWPELFILIYIFHEYMRHEAWFVCRYGKVKHPHGRTARFSFSFVMDTIHRWSNPGSCFGGFNPWPPICSSLYSLRKLTPVAFPLDWLPSVGFWYAMFGGNRPPRSIINLWCSIRKLSPECRDTGSLERIQYSLKFAHQSCGSS